MGLPRVVEDVITASLVVAYHASAHTIVAFTSHQTMISPRELRRELMGIIVSETDPLLPWSTHYYYYVVLLLLQLTSTVVHPLVII